jgi:lysophospholipase L1-like esterase
MAKASRRKAGGARRAKGVGATPNTRGAQSISSASSLGKALAARVVRRRAAERRQARPVRPVRPVRRRALGAAAEPEIPRRTLRALERAPATGLLVAEGDSWFDYPLNDVLSMLEDEYGFDVEDVAHKGDRVEDMAYSAGQFDDFTRLLEKLLRQKRVPDAILLSGGGNDLTGDDFAILLNHAASGLPTLNADVVRGVIDVRVKNAYAFLIGGLTEIAMRLLDRPIPILLHGYDYAVPDGRGFLGGSLFLPGPWLQPGFRRKGYDDLDTNTKAVESLIDRFNEMLEQLSGAPGFGHVRYVDLRKTLSNAANYKRDWDNELHPTKRGFKAVAEKIARAI